jgi:hypothetical protein
MRLAPYLLVAITVVIAASSGCGYRVRVGEHDAGSGSSCGAGSDCEAGNQCVCGRCISLDLVPPSCDPSCATAQVGDFCTTEGRVCPLGACERLACRGGSFVRESGECSDAGWCECPPPPPGCVYDGSPCVCDHLTCEGQRCGRVTCGEGTTCCNPTCGTCTPPGAGCAAIVCEPDCSPMQAWGQGGCEAVIGVFWNGMQCVSVSGCSCEGPDCANAFETYEQCEAVFSACGAACGGFAGATCGSSEWCDFPDGWLCGGTDGQGVCRTRPTVCPPVIAPVCGCDGQTYQSACDAYGAGTDVATDGPCAP